MQFNGLKNARKGIGIKMSEGRGSSCIRVRIISMTVRMGCSYRA